jgi:hypothetical protein
VAINVQMPFSPLFTPNLKCHSTAKLLVSKNYTTLVLGEMEVLKQKFEERGKVLPGHMGKVDG